MSLMNLVKISYSIWRQDFLLLNTRQETTVAEETERWKKERIRMNRYLIPTVTAFMLPVIHSHFGRWEARCTIVWDGDILNLYSSVPRRLYMRFISKNTKSA